MYISAPHILLTWTPFTHKIDTNTSSHICMYRNTVIKTHITFCNYIHNLLHCFLNPVQKIGCIHLNISKSCVVCVKGIFYKKRSEKCGNESGTKSLVSALRAASN